jgi:hypothetical protein
VNQSAALQRGVVRAHRPRAASALRRRPRTVARQHARMGMRACT